MTTSATSGTGPTENSLRRALKRARDGVALDVNEAAVLLQARGEALDDLTASAARVRDAGLDAAGRSGVITYSKSVFIPLTRLCRDKCHYCTFVTVPGKLAHYAELGIEEVVVQLPPAGEAEVLSLLDEYGPHLPGSQ